MGIRTGAMHLGSALAVNGNLLQNKAAVVYFTTDDVQAHDMARQILTGGASLIERLKKDMDEIRTGLEEDEAKE